MQRAGKCEINKIAVEQQMKQNNKNCGEGNFLLAQDFGGLFFGLSRMKFSYFFRCLKKVLM